MKRALVALVVAAASLRGAAAGAADPPPAAAPLQPQDYTRMWWAEGFPAHHPGAPWRRVIETGRYAFVLDTDTLRVPHFGPMTGSLDYAGSAGSDDRAWAALPAAGLALSLTVSGRVYRATAGGAWSAGGGPRVVESGRFLQRADVTDLAFTAADGMRLNVEARFETVAWPDRLALILAARPGPQPLGIGEAAFGRVGGGFGLDASNHLEVAYAPDLDPERFTLELWAFVPTDHQPSRRTHPWLVCKNLHEAADGNYGLVILNGRAQARLNIGGGATNAFRAGGDERSALHLEAWNHLALSYDGTNLQLYVNGADAGSTRVGRSRRPGVHGLAFGRRQDGSGDGYPFRGLIDEVRLYDRALSAAEVRDRHLRPEAPEPAPPVRSWSFRADGPTELRRPRARWNDATMELRWAGGGRPARGQWALPAGSVWGDDWREVTVTAWPGAGAEAGALTVRAEPVAGGAACVVEYDAARGWHRIDLNRVPPTPAPAGRDARNDVVERVRLVLANPGEREQVARLLLAKTAGGFRNAYGSDITGLSALLRDAEGSPLGLPVQLSKNWHRGPVRTEYEGPWFHGFTEVRVPPRTTRAVELTLAYGHWGGLPAASHAQLSLIGWGSHQLWDESALGAWGESICYEPDRVQAGSLVLDVRPLLVSSMSGGGRWNWTHNVGGADFLRVFDPAGARRWPAGQRTTYLRQGPCLTEVTYAGTLDGAVDHAVTASLARGDDLVRAVYRLRLDVRRALPISRLVIFQIGSDSYNYSRVGRMAVGDAGGLVREWATQPGGDVYRTAPLACTGTATWVSLHEGGRRAAAGNTGAWANRGWVIRGWSARLGGRAAAPWLAERGGVAHGEPATTADLVPPPGLTRLESGDFVDAVLEFLVVPQRAEDYYGPNEPLRAALREAGNTWRMVEREARDNQRQVAMERGTLERLHPDIRVRAERDFVAFTVRGGLGQLPVTITGLSRPAGFVVQVDGAPLDQSVHGRDFWQTDFDPATRTWSQTYNVPAAPSARPLHLQFSPEP